MKSNQLEELRDNWLDEATIGQMQEKMESGELSSEGLTLMYLANISLRDVNVNAVLEINPQALQIAQALDYERSVKGPRSSLHGIPVLLKDNIDTGDHMHTSAGSLSMQNHFAEKDAFLVQKLRDAGAVILGKTNMTEWANFMSDRMTNGWSSRGGQVKNPYGPFDVGGSSSGSGAAIASNMAAFSIGTETSGSILNPSAQNGIVGLKPTVGAISRTGVIPLSHTQDTPGPMARTVEDVTIAFAEMVGYDEEDPVTIKSTVWESVDWLACLNKNALKGVRLGIAREIFEKETKTETLEIFEQAIEKLKRLGATIVDEIDLGTMENDLGYDVLLHEFKSDLNAYLAKTTPTNPIRSLQDVIQFNNSHSEETLQFGQSLLESSDRISGTLTEREYIEALERNRHLAGEIALGEALEKHDVAALVFPQDHGCSFGAAAGYPSITVPAGFTGEGEPFNITFSGRAFAEPNLIAYAYSFEQATKARRKPQWLEEDENQ
ncbi:amidase family protein [Chungangia koreensis]|uniref:Amidase family protein n=1 Tax=Chungangia koreensis TaxID=752657 RepID=A0ABV8X302_9LACT